MIYESCVDHTWPKLQSIFGHFANGQNGRSWQPKLVTFSATLHILAGPKLKVKCELELPTAATTTTATRENEHSWGFMSEHAKETGSDKGLEEQQQEHARGGGEGELTAAAPSQAAA